MRQWRDAAYLQDDWKILPSLTLNLGVRYSYEQPNYEQNNKMVNVNIPLAKFAPLGTSIQTMMSYAGQYNRLQARPTAGLSTILTSLTSCRASVSPTCHAAPGCSRRLWSYRRA